LGGGPLAGRVTCGRLLPPPLGYPFPYGPALHVQFVAVNSRLRAAFKGVSRGSGKVIYS
jgi:hypothetical protein